MQILLDDMINPRLKITRLFLSGFQNTNISENVNYS